MPMDAYLAFRAFGAIAPRVSAKVGYTLIGWLSDLIYRRGTATVRGLRDNIRHAMGALASPGEVDEAARRVAKAFLDRFAELCGFLLPRYRAEGKSYLTIAIGCTGGRHRSVAIANALASSAAPTCNSTVSSLTKKIGNSVPMK